MEKQFDTTKEGPGSKKDEGKAPAGEAKKADGARQGKRDGRSNIPAELLAQMEAAFRADFSDVMVHTGSAKAVEMHALAYAQGNDIHFAPGAYNPTSDGGKRLLGHELAHVVQQRQGRVAPQAGEGQPVNKDPGLEAEAEAMANVAAAGGQASTPPSAAGAGGGGVMQLYQLVDPKAWKDAKGKDDVSARFPTQGIKQGDYEATPFSEDKQGKTPTLKVASSGQMALEHTTDQPKTFYASADVIEQSNAKLKAKSSIELRPWNSKIDVPSDPTKAYKSGDPMTTLERVEPSFEKGTSGTDVSLKAHECIEVLRTIVGSDLNSGQGIAVMGAPDRANQGQQQKMDFLYGGPQAVAEQLVHNKPGRLDPMSKPYATGAKRKEDIAAPYGTMGDQERSDRAKNMGVNEHASPEVGEGFGTFHIPTHYKAKTGGEFNLALEEKHPELRKARADMEAEGKFDTKMTYEQTMAELVQRTRKSEDELSKYFLEHTWNAHYAGVVARSGADVITLENYNRDPVPGWQAERIFRKLFADFADFREASKGVVGKKSSLERIQQTKQKLTNSIPEVDKAIESLQALDASRDKKETQWYFQMFGPAQETLVGGAVEDQSFHKAMMDIGDFANPVTMRLRSDITDTGSLDKAAAALNVEEVKDLYTDVQPDNPDVTQVEKALYGVLAYANQHLDEDVKGRRSRVVAMRQWVKDVEKQVKTDKLKLLITHTKGAIDRVERSKFVR